MIRNLPAATASRARAVLLAYDINNNNMHASYRLEKEWEMEKCWLRIYNMGEREREREHISFSLASQLGRFFAALFFSPLALTKRDARERHHEIRNAARRYLGDWSQMPELKSRTSSHKAALVAGALESVLIRRRREVTRIHTRSERALISSSSRLFVRSFVRSFVCSFDRVSGVRWLDRRLMRPLIRKWEREERKRPRRINTSNPLPDLRRSD